MTPSARLRPCTREANRNTLNVCSQSKAFIKKNACVSCQFTTHYNAYSMCAVILNPIDTQVIHRPIETHLMKNNVSGCSCFSFWVNSATIRWILPLHRFPLPVAVQCLSVCLCQICAEKDVHVTYSQLDWWIWYPYKSIPHLFPRRRKPGSCIFKWKI